MAGHFHDELFDGTVPSCLACGVKPPLRYHTLDWERGSGGKPVCLTCTDVLDGETAMEHLERTAYQP